MKARRMLDLKKGQTVWVKATIRDLPIPGTMADLVGFVVVTIENGDSSPQKVIVMLHDIKEKQ